MGCKHSNRAARKAAKGYWELINAGEPYRLLFPVGTLIGLLGVLLWPLHFYQLFDLYPGSIHARIMIQNFLGCFVIGFLGTAFPRLLDVSRVHLPEALLYAGLLISSTVFHLFQQTLIGDAIFLSTFLLFLGNLIARFTKRQDTPPPGFVLVGLGMLCAIFGTVGLILITVLPIELIPTWFLTFPRLLLYQGFLLLPIMGLGAFLLPRFFGLPNKHNFPTSLTPPPGWLKRAVFAFFCACFIIAGFLFESFAYASIGNGLKAFGVALYLFREIPVHRTGFGDGALALGLKIALFSIPLGFTLIAFMPAHLTSFLHVVYITGFSLLTFTVASRVLLGHSGQASKFKAWLPSILCLIAFQIIAMVTRVSADWLPALTQSHYSYAAMGWVVSVLIWTITLLPAIRLADSE